MLKSPDKTGDSDLNSWQSCGRLHRVQAETEWIVFTSWNHSSPTSRKKTQRQRLHEFMNQMRSAGVSLACSPVCIPVKASSLPGKVIQRVFERFTWTQLFADSLHALLRSTAWNASPGILWVTASPVSPSFSYQRQDNSHNPSMEHALALKQKGDGESNWKTTLTTKNRMDGVEVEERDAGFQ